MHRRTLLAATAAAPWLMAAATPPHIVASFSILADMARQIAGADARIDMLVPVNGDAHTYQPRPGDLRALDDAALLVTNGLGLEGWLDRLVRAAGYHGTEVIATTGIQPRMLREGGRVSIDPHGWQDPRNGAGYAHNIAAGLAQAVPARAAEYRDAGARYAAAIGAVDGWAEAKLATIPADRRRIITTHDAFGYYGARYSIEFIAAEGLSTDAEPSAKSIAALVAQIRREKIRAVFIENMTDPRIARMLAAEAGAVLGGTVYSDALSTADGPAATYLAMLRHNTELFAAAM